MEIVASILLGAVMSLAAVLAYIQLKKDLLDGGKSEK